MTTPAREAPADESNPLGLDGIEFVEYATSRPQALGQVLEMLGFQPVARHRSREVTLYRQGGLNVIVNAHESRLPHCAVPSDKPVIAAIALRVKDASHAYRRALERGAWAVPTQVEVMELNIPAIHGVGRSRIYFVDRHRDFSIYDVDFIPIPGANPNPPPLTGLHFFGVVQYIGVARMYDWTEFYSELLGFTVLPHTQNFGILPKGRILQSPCRSFYLQLIEPPPEVFESEENEELNRIGLGAPDVLATVSALAQRGVEFVESTSVHSGDRGALTRTYAGVSFELVQHAGWVA